MEGTSLWVTAERHRLNLTRSGEHKTQEQRCIAVLTYRQRTAKTGTKTEADPGPVAWRMIPCHPQGRTQRMDHLGANMESLAWVAVGCGEDARVLEDREDESGVDVGGEIMGR